MQVGWCIKPKQKQRDEAAAGPTDRGRVRLSEGRLFKASEQPIPDGQAATGDLPSPTNQPLPCPAKAAVRQEE